MVWRASRQKIDYIEHGFDKGANNVAIEQRRFTRILFDAPCELTQGNRRWYTRVVDISLQGLLLTRPDTWDGDPEENCEAVIYLADNETTITMTVSLVHNASEHLGFLCRTLGLDSATHLRRLVQLNLGDDALLHRELEALVTQ